MNESPVSNGLGDFMQVANLTVVGALVLVFVFGAFWLATKGIPRAFTLVADLVHSGRESEATIRKEFIDALKEQSASRMQAAAGGHEAATKIADNIQRLAEEIRRLADDRRRDPPNGNGSSNGNGSRIDRVIVS
jgi:hypothetical protein